MSLFFFTFLVFSLITVLISIAIPFASFLLTEKVPDKEKSSVYECGFSPIYQPGKPFSVRFFIIAILFLVFDLEIVLLFPWSYSFLYVDLLGSKFVSLFFVVLILGLWYEWVKGGLEWE